MININELKKLTVKEIKDRLFPYNPNACLEIGFDEALIGYTEPVANIPALAIYDYDKVVTIMFNRLKEADTDNTEDEILWDIAEHEVSCNCVRYWRGISTPIFVRTSQLPRKKIIPDGPFFRGIINTGE